MLGGLIIAFVVLWCGLLLITFPIFILIFVPVMLIGGGRNLVRYYHGRFSR